MSRRYLLVGVLAATACAEPEPPLGEIFAEIERRYGVEVRWDVGTGFFPEEWAEHDARAEPIAERELRRMPAILSKALAPYPESLVAADLRRICLAGDLYFFGQPFGGTYDEDSIYICNEGLEAGFDDLYLIGTLHHELSSILMYNHGFSHETWHAANADGFEYASVEDGGIEAIASGEDGLDGNPELYALGLLSEYSKSELEEDYNMYCEVMMSDPTRLRELAASYPRVAAKAELCRNFYLSLGIDVP